MNMQIAPQHRLDELEDLLTFVDNFDIEDRGAPMKAEAANPPEMSDSAWFDELKSLFRDDKPDSVAASEPIASSSNAVNDNKPTKATKKLALPPEALVASATKKTSSRVRVSRKNELEYLRTKVKEMETKLEEMKDKADSGQTSSPVTPQALDVQQDTMQAEQSLAIWKTMAERQKKQRELMEAENAKLREKLKTQVRMAKSLQRILCKRARDNDNDQMDTAAPKRLKSLWHGDNSSAGLFDGMLLCLDEMYAQTNGKIALGCAASMSNPVIRTNDVKHNDIAGMFLEFHDSKLLPFDMQTVSRAMWRFLTETGHKFNNYIEEHVENRDNTMLRRFGVEIKHGNNVAVLFGRQVMRQYLESDRVVFVRHSIIDEIQMAGATTTTGLTFRESGWIVIKNAFETPATGAATVTQAYSTISPDIDLSSNWEVGALTDFVLQSREDIEVGNDANIENLLLQEEAK